MAVKQKNSGTLKDLEEWFHFFIDKSGGLRKKAGGTLIGKFFVVRDRKVLDHYDTFDTAYRACSEQYPDGRFLIQELLPEEYTNFVFVTS